MRRLRAAGAALLLAGLGGLAACSADARGDAGATELTVYAAASLEGAFDEISGAFEAEHPGIAVTVVYDGSATLATQIAEGAPADVFAAADGSSMQAAGEAVGQTHVFATNTLVIAVAPGNPDGIASLRDLARVTTVLCAPAVPCGAASARLLADAGVEVDAASWEQNVTAVLTKVAAGEADAGLVYATDARRDDRVTALVPEGAADVVNRYPITALHGAAHPAAAAAFVAFVRSPAGQTVLARAGFGAP